MLRTSAKLIITAAALALLSGCTIRHISGSDPPARRAANPAKKQPTFQSTGGTSSGSTGSGTSTTPTSSAADLAPRITSPNAFGNGTGGAFKGHAYVIPENTTKMPDFASMIPFATLFTDSFNVQSRSFTGGFPGALVQEDWFAIRYEGSFSLPKDGSYQFKLVSDDGAILYVDGQKVVDNDGKHTSRAITSQRDMKAGAHALRLDYWQAQKGAVALQLFLVEDGKDQLLVGAR
jgi:hypothetical protein